MIFKLSCRSAQSYIFNFINQRDLELTAEAIPRIGDTLIYRDVRFKVKDVIWNPVDRTRNPTYVAEVEVAEVSYSGGPGSIDPADVLETFKSFKEYQEF